MKSVLVSIRPKWCEMIAAGEKTVEVRKTRPKLETPFKCYIYCTLSGANELFKDSLGGDVAAWNREKWGERKGNVIGEFVCNKMSYIEADIDLDGNRHLYNTVFLQHRMCLTDEELFQYLYKGKDKNNGGWGWHISRIVIYDKPKPLSEFFHACDKKKGTDCSVCIDRRENTCKSIARPPQIWCYVEEVSE